MQQRLGMLAVVAVTAELCACAESANGARDVRFGGRQDAGPVLSQAELQQDIQRFAGQFMDNVAEAAGPLMQVQDPRFRELAMRRILLYESTAVDIATGPLPEVNALDMMVFLALAGNALERYWIPRVFGEHGAELAAAFAESQRDMAPIADRLLDTEQQAQLGALVRAWEQAHPGQHRVEGVRFLEFSSVAGRVSIEEAERARGLLAQVKSATQAADQALLLGDRAMFLVHRMPSLIRVQARLGVHETVSDTLDRVDDIEGLLDQVPEGRLLVQDVTHLTSTAAGAAREARLLVAQAEPLVHEIAERKTQADAAESTRTPSDSDDASLQETLATAAQLTDKVSLLVRQLQSLAPDQPAQVLDTVEHRADRVARRWIGYLALLGAIWALLFWGGYYAVKRLTA